MSRGELLEMVTPFGAVVLDLGTGDGRFVHKAALQNPNNFYIGVDPSQKQLETYSRTSLRKKLANVLYVVASIEMLPQELFGLADTIYIILPWGSLLKAVINPSPKILGDLKSLLKDAENDGTKSLGTLQIVFGYSQDFEPSETTRLEIEDLDLNKTKEKIVPRYEDGGFKCINLTELGKDELKNFETTWSKKLSFGQDRPLFRLEFKV